MNVTGKIVVLRDLNWEGRGIRRETTSRTHALSILRSQIASPSDAPPPDPSLDIADDTPEVRNDLMRDPSVLGIAPPLPLSLIEPKAREVASVDLTAARADGVTWGVKAVGAHASAFDGEGVSVAVLDTGIDPDHEAFCGGLHIEQKDFTATGNGDVDGHGTHCAATIFGRSVNGIRIGVAPGVQRALIAKVIGGGAGSTALVDALSWALEERAQVISMSLGFDIAGYAADLQDQLNMPAISATSVALEAFAENVRLFDTFAAMNNARAAFSGGAVIVAAAGNESNHFGHYSSPPYTVAASLPSAADGILSVGALDAPDPTQSAVAPFSNSAPDVMGPGVGVISAKANTSDQLAAMSGTSMACPHIAGLAALHWQAMRAGGGASSADIVMMRLRASATLDAIDLNGVALNDVGLGLPIGP